MNTFIVQGKVLLQAFDTYSFLKMCWELVIVTLSAPKAAKMLTLSYSLLTISTVSSSV